MIGKRAWSKFRKGIIFLSVSRSSSSAATPSIIMALPRRMY